MKKKNRDITKSFFKFKGKVQRVIETDGNFVENQNEAHRNVVDMVMKTKCNGDEWGKECFGCVTMKENAAIALKQGSDAASSFNAKKNGRAESFKDNVVVNTKTTFSNMVSENKEMVSDIASKIESVVTVHEEGLKSWINETLMKYAKKPRASIQI